MARILMLSLVFPPDNVSTAQLMAELAEDLCMQGHCVDVVTTEPHYNPDLAAMACQPLVNKVLGLVKRSEYRGIAVYHVWMPRKGSNKLYRIATWMWFHVVSTLLALMSRFRPDVIFCPSPPLSIALSAWVVSRAKRVGFVYNVQELYPDVAINLGMVRNPGLIALLYRFELFVYKKAARITAISPRMCGRIMDKGIQSEKVVFIPNSVDVDGFSPGPKDNVFSRAHDVSSRFVVSYAGNMGKPQHLELLLQAAEDLKGRKDVHFILMGNGSERESLLSFVKTRALPNVTFLPQQAYAVMPLAYAAADLCYVPQALGASNDGIPSKVYRIFAAGRAVLAVTAADSDLADLVQKAKAGVVVTTSSSVDLSAVIARLAVDRPTCVEMGRNGRAHVAKYYDRRVTSAAYDRLLREVAGKA